ncbi:hypothetical protein BBP00_00008945 [Phytophthora kernoviae]|uniref:Protein kinase domain-containing protein n=1 Tax=Phytophthora kernoviae TaxID=325452 RepID=A0A3F2RE09_9STRA|nr:hypothetical protein BBP00_00008945 [Phytophthora kernoviae]
MESENVYSDSSCSSVPVSMSMTTSSSCVASDCSEQYSISETYYTKTVCPSNALTYAADVYGSTKYVLIQVYSDTDCTTYSVTAVVIASGQCEVLGSTGASVITTIYSNGSVGVEYYLDSSCTYTTSSSYIVNKDLLTSHACIQGIKLYSNSDGSTTSGASGSSSGLGIGTIVGIIAGILVVILIIAGILFWRCRQNRAQQQQQVIETPRVFEQAASSSEQFYRAPVTPKRTTGTESTVIISSDGPTPSKLWDDEAIVAARIPREKVVAEHLINRGGFGEVYAGTYNGHRVAIKMLLPERKKSIQQVNKFLSEVKLMTTLDHPHIVTFIGVAWDSLTDLCVVTEYMIIDLRALLIKFQEQHMPTGFDHDKVKVALHVAHALTYLHSCAPPVIHRDLKSSNILLNETMDAKVTDFGISRERVDATMTAGVGTSLWMAPEVMLGERYDDKADMFSFGVVLSELDSHTLPYVYAKHNNSGRRITDAAILQLVSSGQLHVQFSSHGPKSMVELGLACVAGTACTTYIQTVAVAASGECEVSSTEGQGVIATLFSNGLWDDDVIVAARIPREKVFLKKLINRGGFGEVYVGTYNGKQVAIKMLLPETKKRIPQVNAFLSEVKLMAGLDHPRIASFIGVAWDSLTDLCVVSEYMAGGDLKVLLGEFEKKRRPIGFDYDKVKIALHVSIALTYLHSCAPPVIHRDLKSKNILLNEKMDAKVTDFGISRERVDTTMTGGIGTSFWMAPEVMLGERYDDKADMFSFGVVLAELDSHVLPYSNVKGSNTSQQSKLPNAAILQMVASGKLRVEFSEAGPKSMIELGLACVSLDPKQRPTAAEALYKLQKVLAKRELR